MSRTIRELYANSTQQEIDALREQLRDGIDVIRFLRQVSDDIDVIRFLRLLAEDYKDRPIGVDNE